MHIQDRNRRGVFAYFLTREQKVRPVRGQGAKESDKKHRRKKPYKTYINQLSFQFKKEIANNIKNPIHHNEQSGQFLTIFNNF